MARATDKRWKGHLIDWPTIAAMDSEDYELKSLNQQQVAILLMLLEYQKWETRWTNLGLSKDELAVYIGDIEVRLMQNEGGGMATKEDIRDGMYEAINRLALQIVTGSYVDVSLSTDEDGTVTQTPEGDGTETAIEDNPATPAIDEGLASQMAGATAVARGLELFFDKLDTYYGATNGTPTSTAATAKFGIKAYFPNDGAAMDTAIDIYYTYRTTNARLLFNTSVTFEQYLFCYGANEQGFNRWLIDSSGYADNKISTMHDLVTGLHEDFFSQYFATGAKGQNTEYRTATCTKIDTENYTLNMALADSYAFTTGVWKDNHRYLVEWTGTYTDTDNPNVLKDGMWSINTVTGAKSFDGFTLTHTGTVAPVGSQVPYQAGHVYAVTIEKVGNNAGTITKTNAEFALPNTVGTLTLKITDLGLIS